jgi:hypothetical protein
METALTTTDQPANLPTVPLSRQFQALLLRELVSGFSIETATKMAAMPANQLQTLIEKQLLILDRELTREQCDVCLRNLALTLPHANMAAADAHDVLELYHGLLTKYGVTGRMLSEACERYVMAKNSGKGKFFPGPGQLYELCSGDVRYRNRQRAALTMAQTSLRDMVAEMDSFEPPARPLRTVAEILAENRKSVDELG